MDGQVRCIREALTENGLEQTLLMAYSTKFASSLYGPFRDAENSAPSAGDRKGYQASWGNPRAALRESEFDEEEGADILMVKPALAYLDVIRRVRDAHPEIPLLAYNVSGEYAMLKAAIANGWLSEAAILETLTSIKRAGADAIISYHAKEVAELL